MSRWDTDPWSFGSYSALPVGTDASVRATIANALLGGRIAIAGEFAATDYPATVHGAYLSGIRAARRIDAAVPRGTVLIVEQESLAWRPQPNSRGADARSRLSKPAIESGRVHTVVNDGVAVELGAAWVHGVTGNPIADLVQSAGAG